MNSWIESMEPAERPSESAPETMWSEMAVLCESDEDLIALFEMYDQAHAS
jgi:hypothetical protein